GRPGEGEKKGRAGEEGRKGKACHAQDSLLILPHARSAEPRISQVPKVPVAIRRVQRAIGQSGAKCALALDGEPPFLYIPGQSFFHQTRPVDWGASPRSRHS